MKQTVLDCLEAGKDKARDNGRLFALELWGVLAFETRCKAHIKLTEQIAAWAEFIDPIDPWEDFQISEYLPSWVFPIDTLCRELGLPFTEAAETRLFELIRDHNLAGI